MKKKFFSVAIVAVIALGAGWNVMQSENEKDLSDLILANVEALANSETGGGKRVCYHTITSKEGSQVRYCQTCDWVDGTSSWVSSTSEC